MKAKLRPAGLSTLALIVLAAWLPASSQAQEIWAVRGGTTTISFDASVLEPLTSNGQGTLPVGVELVGGAG